MKIDYTIPIPCVSDAEGDRKAASLAKLANALDGRTLEALANKGPQILKDPIQGPFVRSKLGL
jgi:hypothetical protein